MKNKKITNEKIEEQSSGVLLVIIFILGLATVFLLPNINHIFWNTGSVTDDIVEEDEGIPSTYTCSYGPAYDEFYGYTKYEYVAFNFDKNGDVDAMTSEIKYQVYSLTEYNKIIEVMTLPDVGVTYDNENYVITVKENNITNTTYPTSYIELKSYLSSNHYTCTSE